MSIPSNIVQNPIMAVGMTPRESDGGYKKGGMTPPVQIKIYR